MAFRYKAFVSYAHADKTHARAIHSRLETFRTPKGLVGGAGRWGEVAARLAPIFRDRDELTTGSALGPELQKALSGSQFLLVLCSPASANSRWVNEEIRHFRAVRGDEFILAAIVEGDPAAPVGEGLAGCFPPALVEPETEGGPPREPIAADFRADGDGKRLAFLKLAAGMLGVGLDDLVRRDAQRRQRQLAQVAGVLFAGLVVTSGLAVYAETQRRAATEQRAIAERERDTVSAALDYLVSIFEIANPATENPKTITALTILERGREKIDTELAGRPEVQAKLMGAMGDVYANLGEMDEAESLLTQTIALPSVGVEDRLNAELRLADVYFRKGSLEDTARLADKVEAELEAELKNNPGAVHDASAVRARAAEMKALVAYGSANQKQAADLYEIAKEIYATSDVDHREEVARINIAQGMMWAYLGEFEASRTSLNSAYEYFADRYADNHVMTAIALNNLAYAEFTAGDVETAVEIMPRALAVFENVLEPNHPNIATASLLLGRIQYAAGDYAASIESLVRAENAYRAAYGDNNTVVGTTLMYRAKFQAERGDAAEATQAIGEAERIYALNFAQDDANTGDLLVHKALVMNAAGNVVAAREVCADGLSILENSESGQLAWVEENREICRKIE